MGTQRQRTDLETSDRDDSDVRTVTGIRPAPRRPETQPPTQLVPAALRPARVPKPSVPPPGEVARPAGATKRVRPPPVPVTSIEASLREARARLERGLGELDALRGQLDERVRRLDALLGETGERLASLEARLTSLEGSRAKLAGDLRAHLVDVWLDRLEQASRKEDVDERLDILEQGAALVPLRMRLDRIGARVEAVETAAAGLDARLRRAEEGPELARLRMRLDRIGLRIDALEVDDLTQIDGVGRRYAEGLRGLQIRTFAQLAGWTDDDVTIAAARLGVAPRRLRAWVARAAELAAARR